MYLVRVVWATNKLHLDWCSDVFHQHQTHVLSTPLTNMQDSLFGRCFVQSMMFCEQINLTDRSIDLFVFWSWAHRCHVRVVFLRYLPEFRRHMPVLAFLEDEAVLVSFTSFKQLFASTCLWFIIVIFLIICRQKLGTLGRFEIIEKMLGRFEILRKLWAILKF